MLEVEEVESLLVFTNVLLQAGKYKKVVAVAQALQELQVTHSSMLRMHAAALIKLGFGKEALGVLEHYPVEELSREEKQVFFLMKATALWNIKSKKNAFIEIKKFIALRN